jgi:Tfp pilus assembly protein PilN
MSQFRTTSLAFSTRGQRMWRRNQNTVAFSPAAALGPVTHTVLIALMIAVLGLIYLTQVTKTSYYGYQLDERQTKLDGLLAEKQNLEVENARLQALERVKNSSVAANMENPSSTDYAAN